MKSLQRKVLVVVVFMLGTLFNYANDAVSEGIIGAKKVKVVFENVQKGQLLTVTDNRGHVLHEEYISKKGDLVKVFDFSHLNLGSYKIVIEKKSQTIIKPFELKMNGVSFKKDIVRKTKETKEFFKPVIKLNKDNKVLISRINFDKKPLNVAIYYKDEVILDEKASSNETIINKIYQLDSAHKGDYKVIVRNNGESFVSKFSI